MPAAKGTAGEPIAARKRDAADGVLQKVLPAERGNVIAVGNGLAETDQIRLEAEIAVAARKAQAEAGAHVVNDQQCTLLGAKFADLLPEAVGRKPVIGKIAVHIRLRDNCGNLTLVRMEQRLQTLEIVPVCVQVVADILLEDAGVVDLLCPGRNAMVIALKKDDFFARVKARAVITASVVTSLPFLAKNAQSAVLTVSTSSSAKSIITAEGAVTQSSFSRCFRAASSTSGSP